MSIKKKEGEEESRIDGEDALRLLLQIMDRENVKKSIASDIYLLIHSSVQNKITINRKPVFEKRAETIFKNFKENLDNDDCFEASQKILQLFCDKRKSKIRLYIEDNHIIITIAVAAIVPILLFAINLFIGK